MNHRLFLIRKSEGVGSNCILGLEFHLGILFDVLLKLTLA